MTKLRRFQIARQLLDKYGIDLHDETDFYLLWISGQQLLAAAETSKTSQAFQQAADRLTAALQKPEAKRDLASASQCRYELAYCQFKLGRHFESAELYASMISALAAVDRTMAANAAWMAFAGYQKSLDEHPEGRRKAIRVLETLKREFPQSPHAEKVDYQISLLQRDNQSPQQAMAELESIDPANESYLDSRYDLCLLAHQQWGSLPADQRSAMAAKILSYVDAFLNASASADPKRRLKCMLIAADVLSSAPDPDLSLAGKYLQQAGSVIQQDENPGALTAEYHYRMLQVAMRKNHEPLIRQHAGWITENAPGSPYELPALVQRAQRLAADEADPEQGYQVYHRLVEILGTDADAVKQNKNARVSLFNLAKYAAAVGRFEESADAIERVLQTDPKNKQYLKLAAKSNFQAGNHQRTVEHYRTLVRGTKAGSDEWYEAKYFHIASLMKSDPEIAKQVLKQFQLMHQDLRSPWNTKFQQLSRQESNR